MVESGSSAISTIFFSFEENTNPMRVQLHPNLCGELCLSR